MNNLKVTRGSRRKVNYPTSESDEGFTDPECKTKNIIPRSALRVNPDLSGDESLKKKI